MNFKPLHDRILVKRIEQEQKTAGGILIPDSAQEKPIQGEIVAVGGGLALENGQIKPLAVAVGNKILFGKYSGTEIKLDGVEYLIMKESDVYGIIG
ncbi:MAG: co-chaperone GroES [Alphaproteobacteria bacterium]|jgi:chaperonin GroES|nr:co-chaperone GroES [Alphaproteobacteria bacterium]